MFICVSLRLVCHTLHDQSFQSSHTSSPVQAHRNDCSWLVVVVVKVDNRRIPIVVVTQTSIWLCDRTNPLLHVEHFHCMSQVEFGT